MAEQQTVAAYLAQLPDDRRREVKRMRAVVRENLPAGYEERMAGQVIAYVVPLSVYPDTYNKQALWYVGIASMKNYLTLHLLPVYGSPVLEKKLRDGFAAAGKKLKMGKGCLNFTSVDDLALDTIGEIVAALPMDRYIAVARSWKRK